MNIIYDSTINCKDQNVTLRANPETELITGVCMQKTQCQTTKRRRVLIHRSDAPALNPCGMMAKAKFSIVPCSEHMTESCDAEISKSYMTQARPATNYQLCDTNGQASHSEMI